VDAPVACSPAELGGFVDEDYGRVCFFEEEDFERELGGYWSVVANKIVGGYATNPEEAHDSCDVLSPAPAEIRHVDEAADEGCE